MGIALGAVAFALSLLPGNIKYAMHTSGKLHPYFHLGVFSILGALSILSFDKARQRVLLAIGAVLLGLSIEYSEKLRYPIDFEFYDVVTDTAGVLIGVLVGLVLARRMQSRLE